MKRGGRRLDRGGAFYIKKMDFLLTMMNFVSEMCYECIKNDGICITNAFCMISPI